MARPTKLTPEVQELICKAIRIGATYQAAAEAAGISYDTFNEWRKGKSSKFLRFSEAVDRANADAQLELLQKIQNFTDKDWRAGTWILEHRFKQDYGNSVDVTTKGEPLQPIGVTPIDYRAGLADLAPRPVSNSDAPGEDKDAGDGSQVG